MAANLGERERPAHEVRRILRRQIRMALKALAAHRPGDADIHDARKRIKSARATLRLLRSVMSERDYRRGNRLLRKAAQPLSAPRDAKILVEAFDGVLQRSPPAREVDGARRLRATLVRSRSEARRALLHDGGLQRCCKLLRRARRAAARWSLRSGGAAALAVGASSSTLAVVRRCSTCGPSPRWQRSTNGASRRSISTCSSRSSSRSTDAQ